VILCGVYSFSLFLLYHHPPSSPSPLSSLLLSSSSFVSSPTHSIIVVEFMNLRTIPTPVDDSATSWPHSTVGHQVTRRIIFFTDNNLFVFVFYFTTFYFTFFNFICRPCLDPDGRYPLQTRLCGTKLQKSITSSTNIRPGFYINFFIKERLTFRISLPNVSKVYDYPNYISPDTTIPQIWGDNIGRLEQIKDKYDRMLLFIYSFYLYIFILECFCFWFSSIVHVTPRIRIQEHRLRYTFSQREVLQQWHCLATYPCAYFQYNPLFSCTSLLPLLPLVPLVPLLSLFSLFSTTL
jgi:hypothetical protein